MSPSIQHIEDLTPTQIALLTQLLYLPPHARISSSWLHDQRQLITSFPRPLQQTTSLLSRAILALPVHITDHAVLCRAHRNLNPFLTRQIFLHVNAECTTKLHRLTTPSVRAALPQELREWLRRLERLNSLWMRPELYRTAYSAMPHESRKEWVRSGCEACVLARVGGDVQALVDLRASCLGRTRKRKRKPRLLTVIDGWSGWCGERDRVEEESYLVSMEVRRIRKELQEERRQRVEEKRKRRNDGRARSRHYSPEVQDQEYEALQGHNSWNEIDTDDERKAEYNIGDTPDDDVENAIISHYRNILSTTSLDVQVSGSATQNDPVPHPAFRNSLVYHLPDGTFRHHHSSSVPETDGARDTHDHPRSRSTSGAYGSGPYVGPSRPSGLARHNDNHRQSYAQSQYSRASGFSSAPSPEGAQHRADTYRRLVGLAEHPLHGERGTEWRGRRVAQRRRSGRGGCAGGLGSRGDEDEDGDGGGEWVDDERWSGDGDEGWR